MMASLIDAAILYATSTDTHIPDCEHAVPAEPDVGFDGYGGCRYDDQCDDPCGPCREWAIRKPVARRQRAKALRIFLRAGRRAIRAAGNAEVAS